MLVPCTTSVSHVTVGMQRSGLENPFKLPLGVPSLQAVMVKIFLLYLIYRLTRPTTLHCRIVMPVETQIPCESLHCKWQSSAKCTPAPVNLVHGCPSPGSFPPSLALFHDISLTTGSLKTGLCPGVACTPRSCALLSLSLHCLSGDHIDGEFGPGSDQQRRCQAFDCGLCFATG